MATFALAGAMLPDLDLRVPGVAHRGPTHTVWFALAIGGLVAVALASAGIDAGSDGAGLVESVEPVALTAFGGVVAAATVGSHLLADAFTPMGVRPFEPVSDRQYTLDVANASETVEEWAEHAIRMHFAWIDHEADRHTATPEVEVPPLLAERARLEAESARQHGKDTTVEEILMNEVEIRPEYQVEGSRVVADDE